MSNFDQRLEIAQRRSYCHFNYGSNTVLFYYEIKCIITFKILEWLQFDKNSQNKRENKTFKKFIWLKSSYTFYIVTYIYSDCQQRSLRRILHFRVASDVLRATDSVVSGLKWNDNSIDNGWNWALYSAI